MKRPALYFALSFLISTFFLTNFTYSNTANLEIFVICVGVFFLLMFMISLVKFALDFKKKNSKKIVKTPVSKLILKLTLIFFATFLSSVSYLVFVLLNETDVSKLDGMPIACTATVLDVSTKGGSVCYTVCVKDAPSNLKMLVGKRAVLYSNTETVFDYHDMIALNATIKLPTNNGGFDTLAYYREQKIAVMLNSISPAKLISPAKKSVLGYVKMLSNNLRNRVDKLLKAPYSGLLRAMLLGDTSDMDMFSMHYIQKSGISHAFSVSGMHVSILSSILLLLLAFLPMPIHVRQCIAIVFVWLIVAITGMGIPACRAGIMTTCFLSAPLFRRRSDAITSLLVSGVILLIGNPVAIKSASFLMTFAATGGVLVLSPMLSAMCIERFSLNKKGLFNGCIRGAVNSVAPSLAATITTFPITTIFFGGLSLVSPITNLLLLPILPILLCGGILLLLVSYIPFLSALIPIFTAVIESCFAFLLIICKLLSSFKFSYLGLDFKFVSVWLCAISVYFACYFIFRKKFDKIRCSNALLCGVSILIIAAGFNICLTRDDVFIEAFSSSKGSSVAVMQGRNAVVISLADDKQSDKNILSLLQNRNIHSLECYIELGGQVGKIPNSVAHGDRDLLFSDYPPKYIVPSQNYEFKPNEGYEINDMITVFMIEEGKGVLLNANKNNVNSEKILFTSDFAVAQNIQCDMLYFCGDYKQVIMENRADKIVFLSGPLNNSQKSYMPD